MSYHTTFVNSTDAGTVAPANVVCYGGNDQLIFQKNYNFLI
jgi:hypothetical protein